MDWTGISENEEVIRLLKQRDELEDRIQDLDENALILCELKKLEQDSSPPRAISHFRVDSQGVIKTLKQ